MSKKDHLDEYENRKYNTLHSELFFAQGLIWNSSIRCSPFYFSNANYWIAVRTKTAKVKTGDTAEKCDNPA